MKKKKAPDLRKAARAIDAFLDALGFDEQREPELRGTGKRVAKAFAQDLLSGYALDARTILGESMTSSQRGLVVMTNVPVTMMCPHHLLPASGVAHLGYFPNGKIVGLGALGQLVDCFSRRLTLQETAAENVADALVRHLGAKGAACMIESTQACFSARHEARAGSTFVTVSFAGSMLSRESQQTQFLQAARKTSR